MYSTSIPQICLECTPGYQSNGASCLPENCTLEGCSICMPIASSSGSYFSKSCLLCNEGYFLNNYFECVPYT